MYAPVTAALEELSSREIAPPLSSSVPLKAGPPVEREEREKTDPRQEVGEEQRAERERERETATTVCRHVGSGTEVKG